MSDFIGCKIIGWGSYRPKNCVSSVELDRRFGMECGWTEAQFGIRARSVAAPEETTSMMAAVACDKALEVAKIDPTTLDVIIGACGVMEQPIPSTAAIVQDRLGLGRSGIHAFDVNQTCLSFMTALDIAVMGIAAERWERTLIFSSDIASAGLNPENEKIRSIFGDGAAAVVVESAPGDCSKPGLLGRDFATRGVDYKLAQLRSGGTRVRASEGWDVLKAGAYFEMDAFGIFKAAAKCLPAVIRNALAQAKLTKDDLDVVLCHQASAPGVEHVRRIFAPNPDRVVNIFANTGNQIATSIPTVLNHALETKIAKSGDTIMMLGAAAGVSAGAMIFRL